MFARLKHLFCNGYGGYIKIFLMILDALVPRYASKISYYFRAVDHLSSLILHLCIINICCMYIISRGSLRWLVLFTLSPSPYNATQRDFSPITHIREMFSYTTYYAGPSITFIRSPLQPLICHLLAARMLQFIVDWDTQLSIISSLFFYYWRLLLIYLWFSRITFQPPKESANWAKLTRSYRVDDQW